MIFVFHVDTGTTITFEMNYALQNVSHLMEAIERECGVPVGEQVLLMSGGESLEPDARVCSYSSGTDTNPIFLFSKALIQSTEPPPVSIDYGSDTDLNTRVKTSDALPVAYQSLVERTSLAQQFWTLAREQTRICEHLVHDQHLQQQGWAAVVANLEDITQNFQSRIIMLQQSFESFLTDRQRYQDLLKSFKNDLQTLEKIPILPILRAQADGRGQADDSETAVQTAHNNLNNNNPDDMDTQALSLLKWISAKDNQSTLEQVADQCTRGMEHIGEAMMDSLKAEAEFALQASDKPDMKEIGGLGDRLYGLETFMAQMRKLLNEQQDLAQSLLCNQNRVSHLGDESVLPDLCNSHRAQLSVMLNNHNLLRDIRRRITKAKEELAKNIYHRLKWIMHVESKILEVDWKVALYQEHLRRLRRHMEILQQIHLAPELYVNAVIEVVRRRTFSNAFLEWANCCACKLQQIHNEEVARRRDFNGKFEGHFLGLLIPGLDDLPSSFANEPPTSFDSGLPKLSVEDMEALTRKLPEMSVYLTIPDLKKIMDLFDTKTLLGGSGIGKIDKGGSSMKIDDSTKAQNTPRPSLPERNDFDSETDTDEFEKIGQGASDLKLVLFDKQHKQQSEVGGSMQTVSSYSSLSSPLTRSSMSSEPAACPQLSTLTECVKRHDGSELKVTPLTIDSLINNSNPLKCLCTNNINKRAIKTINKLSGHQSPCTESLANIGIARAGSVTEFFSAEFYIGESLSSSLNEPQEETSNSLLQQSLGPFNEEVERLRGVIQNLRSVTTKALVNFRQDLSEIKDQSIMSKSTLIRVIEKMTDFLKSQSPNSSLDNHDPNVLMFERDKEIAHLQRQLSDKESEALDRDRLVHTIRHQYDSELEERKQLQMTLERQTRQEAKELSDRYQQRIQELEHKLEILQLDHQRDMKEARDKMDTMRSRYKLMAASMENVPIHSPGSDTSLEKLEATVIGEAGKLREDLQITRNMVNQKERQIETCNQHIMQLRQSRHSLSEKIDNLAAKMAADSQTIENQQAIINDLRFKVGHMGFEVEDEDSGSESKKVRYSQDDLKTTNKKLMSELNHAETLLEALEKERARLEFELMKERSNKPNFSEATNMSMPPILDSGDGREHQQLMSTSVAVVSDDKRSNKRESYHKNHHHSISRSSSNLMQQMKINFTSCNPGDIVLALWNKEHRHYTIIQESNTLYFLNSDCAGILDLNFGVDGLPTKLYTFAEVVDKEYCSARKPENRYRVPQGTKFYRVRLRPLQRLKSGNKNL